MLQGCAVRAGGALFICYAMRQKTNDKEILHFLRFDQHQPTKKLRKTNFGRTIGAQLRPKYYLPTTTTIFLEG